MKDESITVESSIKGRGHCMYTDLQILVEDNEKLKKAIEDIVCSVNESFLKNEKIDVCFINNVYERVSKCTQRI